MSSIPNSAMPHAHVHHDDPEPAPASGPMTRLIDTVKAHPRTGIAVGASLVLSAVAATMIPALKAKPAPKKRAPAKKSATATKPAATKPAAKRKS